MAHVSEPEFVGSLTTWAVDGEHKLAKLVEQVEEQVGRRMDGRMQVKPVTSSSVNGTNSYVNGASSIVNGGYGAAAGAQPQQKNEDLSFKSFYAFLFRTIKEPLQRLVPWDAAKAVWEIVWAGLEEGSTGAQVGKDFVEFLTVGKADGEKVRGVNKDVWEQVRRLCSLGHWPDKGVDVGSWSWDRRWSSCRLALWTKPTNFKATRKTTPVSHRFLARPFRVSKAVDGLRRIFSQGRC